MISGYPHVRRLQSCTCFFVNHHSLCAIYVTWCGCGQYISKNSKMEVHNKQNVKIGSVCTFCAKNIVVHSTNLTSQPDLVPIFRFPATFTCTLNKLHMYIYIYVYLCVCVYLKWNAIIFSFPFRPQESDCLCLSLHFVATLLVTSRKNIGHIDGTQTVMVHNGSCAKLELKYVYIIIFV